MHKAGVELRRVSYIERSLCYKGGRSDQGLIDHESGANIISAPAETMSATPEKQAEDFIKRQNLTEDDAFALFDQLRPVQPEQFIGPWKGGSVNTNHPTEAKMESLKWAGKDFRSSEDVDPIMSYQEDGSRVWNADWGHARLRPMQYRGAITTAMIYDDKPIIDYFKYVNDDLLFGAMDAKGVKGTFFFYLYK